MNSGVVINTNVPSIHASRALAANRADLETAMARLSSGKRINSSADDAAGASVALKMKADISSTGTAIRNINDGISYFQTLDGSAAEVENVLVRMREIATQMSNATYDTADTAAADVEYQALIAEIGRIATETKFNRLSTSDNTTDVVIQTGAAASDKVTFKNASLKAADLATFVDVTTTTKANAELGLINTALGKVSTVRATAGANINRLGFALSNAQNVNQQLSSSLSALQDTDYAKESAALARGTVLAQAGTAMLAQANQSPQYVLTLLRG
jgi:flagellin